MYHPPQLLCLWIPFPLVSLPHPQAVFKIHYLGSFKLYLTYWFQEMAMSNGHAIQYTTWSPEKGNFPIKRGTQNYLEFLGEWEKITFSDSGWKMKWCMKKGYVKHRVSYKYKILPLLRIIEKSNLNLLGAGCISCMCFSHIAILGFRMFGCWCTPISRGYLKEGRALC